MKSSQTAKGTSPAVKGTSPAVKGPSPVVKGTSPAVKGASPAVRGKSPGMRGMRGRGGSRGAGKCFIDICSLVNQTQVSHLFEKYFN